MPAGRPKKENSSIENKSIPTPTIEAPTGEKAKLLALYQTLKDLNIRSISDLENQIARTAE